MERTFELAPLFFSLVFENLNNARSNRKNSIKGKIFEGW